MNWCPVLAATVVLPAALVLGGSAGATPGPEEAAAPGPIEAPLVVPVSADLPADLPAPPPADVPADLPAPEAAAPTALPPGDAPEQGLQVKTIQVARSISDAFPQITAMIGVRPDAKPWHPSGKAVDVMIPNAGSAEGIALGDAILAFVMSNADRFGVQDVIWRGVYHTPGGPGGSGYGHFDHVHVTTIGGGYPVGGEVYPR